jgi:hypothetical protein
MMLCQLNNDCILGVAFKKVMVQIRYAHYESVSYRPKSDRQSSIVYKNNDIRNRDTPSDTYPKPKPILWIQNRINDSYEGIGINIETRMSAYASHFVDTAL